MSETTNENQNSAMQQGEDSMGPIPCLYGNHPVFVYNNWVVVAHYDQDQGKCPGSGQVYPYWIARAFERADTELRKRASRISQLEHNEYKLMAAIREARSTLSVTTTDHAGSSAQLRAKLDQVDDVLMLDHIAAVNGDYRKALHELVSFEIQIHDDPAVSEIAAKRKADVAQLEADITQSLKAGLSWMEKAKAAEQYVAELGEDKARLDWMETFIETGVIETAFELDGGIHLTLSTVGDAEPVAYREKNSLREAIDAARAALAKHSEAEKITGPGGRGVPSSVPE